MLLKEEPRCGAASGYLYLYLFNDLIQFSGTMMIPPTYLLIQCM